MYEIKAYVRKAMSELVIDEVAKLAGVASIAVVSLSEFGHTVNDGSEMAKVEMVKLEVDVDSESAADTVADTIVRAGRTQEGHPGDGKVLISRLAKAIRIDDGVSGPEALRARSV
ncbi:P-II family nitrogen regulator [Marinobacter metalliresistant]|uniref:P-II family nitrogen regulator n=1 Tax=Marinobacter metalliresistant TaxID=2961995 RepID=A0ABZ2VZL5_9GAMM